MAADTESLFKLLNALESIPPFDDPKKIYTLNRDFAGGKCGDYARMIRYVLEKSGYDCAQHYNLKTEWAHQYDIVKTSDQLTIVDWTQSQFFGEKHFRGTFDDLVKYAQQEHGLPDTKSAIEKIHSYYGVRSESDLAALFERRHLEQKAQNAAQENLHAHRNMVVYAPASERDLTGVVNFNKEVLPKLKEYGRASSPPIVAVSAKVAVGLIANPTMQSGSPKLGAARNDGKTPPGVGLS